jgi:hypothetical protein
MLKHLFLSISFLFTGIITIGDLNGRWQGKVKIADGNEIDITYNFKTDGDKLTGTVVTQWGESPIVNGKYTGDEYTFTQTFNEMVISHSGKVSGDSLFVKIERPEHPVMESVFRRTTGN